MRRQLALVAATVVVGFLPALALTIDSSAPALAPVSDCVVSSHHRLFPASATLFGAGTAGRVVLTPASDGSITVTSVVSTLTYRAVVDKARGGSVQVFFGGQDAQVVFGAKASGRVLEVRVTTCG
jgi:hypothetical protein